MILVYKFSLYAQNKGWVEEDKRDILRYGLELILSNLMIFIIIMLISILFLHPISGLVFTLYFFGIRRYMKGNHLQKYYQCFLISNGLFLLSSIMSQLLIIESLEFSIGIIVAIYSIIFIMMLFDALNKNCRLGKSICYTLVLNLVGVVVLYHIDISYSTLAVYTSIIVLLMKLYDYIIKEEIKK